MCRKRELDKVHAERKHDPWTSYSSQVENTYGNGSQQFDGEADILDILYRKRKEKNEKATGNRHGLVLLSLSSSWFFFDRRKYQERGKKEENLDA